MTPESPVIAREFLTAIGEVKTEIRGIRSDLDYLGKSQEKQWTKHDEEVIQRQAVDAQLLARINQMDGAKSVFKYFTPLIWVVLFGMAGWAAREMWNLKEGVLVLQNTNISPEGWQEVQNAALESQQQVRDVKTAQGTMQTDIDQIKETLEKLAAKPVPKIPAPINKTVIVPAPKDYTFERLLPGAKIDPNPPLKGRPRK